MVNEDWREIGKAIALLLLFGFVGFVLLCILQLIMYYQSVKMDICV